jgi:UDP-glucose 4-epimerase
MTGNKVVVVGGSGFLGSHIADELSECGFLVTIFDLDHSKWLRPDQEMFIGDIQNQGALESCLQNSKYVFHLAGIADIDASNNNPKETVQQNIIGSVNIIESCLKMDVQKILFASSLYVYSDKGSFYRVCKQAVELLLETYNTEYGLRYTNLRYGSLYGPRAQVWNGLKRFVSQAMREKKVVYPGTGEEHREYIHVKDAAMLSVSAIESQYDNQSLTVTGTQVMTTQDVLRMVNEILGGSISLHFEPKGSDYEHSHYSMTPYRYIPKTGYKIVPSTFIDLGQGILEMIDEINQFELNGTNGYPIRGIVK